MNKVLSKTKCTKLGVVLLVCVLMFTTNVVPYNRITYGSQSGADFFTTVNSTLSVTNEADSVKLTVTPTSGTARINYLNYINSSDLSNFITMQVLPSVANSVDFLSMAVILEDSVDPTQQVLTSIAVQTLNSNKKTAATVALTDSTEYLPAQEKWIYSENVNGYQYISNTEQITYGYDNGGWASMTPQYIHFGTTLHGDSTWQGGYYFDQGSNGGPGSNNNYGYLKKDASKDCIPFTMSFVNKEMKIDGFNSPPTYTNGYKIAKIDDTDFLTISSNSLASDNPLKARYTSGHVANMFSSGKVKLSLRFEGIQQTNSVYNEINVRLKALKGQDFYLGEGFSNAASDDVYFNAVDSTVNATNESGSVRLSIAPTARTARINYLNYINSSDLSNFITMQVLPSVVNSVDFLSMSVILEDSVDPTQQVLTSIAVQTLNTNKKTAATVALTDSTEYLPNGELWVYSQNANGYQYLINTSQVTYGYDNGGWATGTPQYTHLGTTLHGDSTWQSGYYFDQGANGGPGSNNNYGYLKKDASKACIPFTMSYVNKEMKIDGFNSPPTYDNGYKIAKIDDSDFLTVSKSSLAVDSPYRARYTSEHVANLFSSGKVKLSLRFEGIQQTNGAYNKINIRLKALKGENFTTGTGFSRYNMNYTVAGNNLLYGVAVNTTKTGFMTGLEMKSITGVVKLYNGAVELGASDKLRTGTRVEVNTGYTTTNYTAAVKGDTTGDGNITVADLAAEKAHLIKSSVLSNEYLMAGYVTNDSSITISDVLAIKKHILGISLIS